MVALIDDIKKESATDPFNLNIEFGHFIDEVYKRLKKGAIEYGDDSFDRPIEDLIGEIEQECLDLAGWGFVLWVRLRRVRERLHEGIFTNK